MLLRLIPSNPTIREGLQNDKKTLADIRAERGARAVDDFDPDRLAKNVRLDTSDLRSEVNCILGHCFETYTLYDRHGSSRAGRQ